MNGPLPPSESRETERITVARPAPRWLWLTVPIAGLLALGSITGFFVPNFYTGSPAWTIQGVAQDFADLLLVLPVLVASALLAARGSRRAWLVWLGALSYIVYTFVIYAFAVHYNRLFLAYVAVLGCASWALMGGMRATDWEDVKARFSALAPVRPASLMLLVPAVLFGLMWLGTEVPALLTGTVPKEVTEAGLFTNPVHVLDLAMMLPAMLVAGVLLWRRQALGFGLAVMLLVNGLFQYLTIAVIMIASARAGLPGGPVPMFVAMAAVTAVVLALFLRQMGDAPDRARTDAVPVPRA